MAWSNYHSHCNYCDGKGQMEDFVKFAIAKNIRKYGFSSHAPLPFQTTWTMKEDDFDDYASEFIRLKEKYRSQIDLYIGMEVDYLHEYSNIGNIFFHDKQFDYIIGSIHYLSPLNDQTFWSIDGSLEEFDCGLHQICEGDIREAAKLFYKATNQMISKGGIDIIGHFDKINYHGRNYKEFNTNENWYLDLLFDTLKQVKQSGLILEINTKSLAQLNITYPHVDLYRYILELQIPILVNSDCHYPTNVSVGFERTYETLYDIGFREMHQLCNGKWKPIAFTPKGLTF